MNNKVQFRTRKVPKNAPTPLPLFDSEPIFSRTVSRPIGVEDMEFYESGIVFRMALIISGYNETQWASLQSRTKNRWLDRARQAACMLFNDIAVVERLPCLTKNLLRRV